MKRPPDLTTAEGNFVYFDNIYSTNIQLSDIFQHIFNMRRYLGAIDVTLADHLILCGNLVHRLTEVPIEFRACDDPLLSNLAIQEGYAVAHDFHEYLVVDIPSGLKPYLPEYRKIETQAEDHVHTSIGLPLLYRNALLIKYIDQLALAIEMRYHKHPAATRVTNSVRKTYGNNLEALTTSLLDIGKNILINHYNPFQYRADADLRGMRRQYLSNTVARAKLELNTQLETK